MENNLPNQFKNHLQKQGLGPNTVKNYTADARHFYRWANQSYPQKPFDDQAINAYHRQLTKLPFSPSTVKRKISSLNKFQNWANPKPIQPIQPKTKLNKSNLGKFLAGVAITLIFVFLTTRQLLPAFYSRLTTLGQNGQKPSPTQLIADYSPWIILFQGKLTDTDGQAITEETEVVFRLYEEPEDKQPVWESKTWPLTPDENQEFNAPLGDVTRGDTPLSHNLFFQKEKLYLGISINDNPEITPRPAISTSANAANALRLNGFTASQTAGANTIPVLSQQGDLILAAPSPKIKAVQGTFGIEAEAISLFTPSGSNGNITLAPDGAGVLNLTFNASGGQLINTSAANLGTTGLQTENNLFYGQVANNNGNYNLLKLESGSTPTAKFIVDASGNTTLAGKLSVTGATNIGGVLNLSGAIADTSADGVNNQVLVLDSNNHVVTNQVDSKVWGNSLVDFSNSTTNYLAKFADEDTIADSVIYELSSNIGIGTTAPSSTLDIAGTAQMTGFKLTSSPTAGYVLQSDADGVGSWADVSSTAGPWTLAGTNLYPDDTSYNVGIGTTSPAGVLHLYDTGNTTNLVFENVSNSGGGGTFLFRKARSGPSAPILNDIVGGFNAYTYDGSGYEGTAGIFMFVDGDVSEDDVPSRMSFYTVADGTKSIQERMTIKNSGSVGIGTTDPSTQLDITGDLTIGGDDLFMGTNTANYFLMADGTNYNPVTPAAARTGLGLDAGGAGDIWVEKAGDTMTGDLTVPDLVMSGGDIYPSADSTTAIQINKADGTTNVLNVDTTNGRVGIGTTGPGKELELYGNRGWDSNTFGILVKNAWGPAALQIDGGTKNDAGASGYTRTAAVDFKSGGSLRWGIGIHPSDNSNTGFKIWESQAGDAVRFHIDAGGNVGIGTTDPNQALDVIGTIQASNLLGGAINLTADANGNIIRDPSDINLKEEINPLENALEKVLALKGISFFWKDKARFGGEKEIGLIAQQVEKIVPELVRQGPEYKSVNYPNLTALIVEAIKEQSQKMVEMAQNITQSITSSEVKTKLISPLADEDVVISLKNNQPDQPSKFGKLLVKGKDDQIVASIDSEGHAEVQSLDVTGDATISGELHAKKIFADEIEGFEPITADEEEIDVEALINEILNSPTETAAPPASLNEEEVWVNGDLVVLGRASLADTTVAGSLNIDAALTLADSTINTLEGPLYLQRLSLGGINILDGKIVIDQQGNMKIKNNLTVEGRIALNEITALPEKDLTINLAPDIVEPATEESHFGKLIVKGIDEKVVASIDASGRATFKKIIIASDTSQEASSATSEESSITTNATAGQAVLEAGKKEVKLLSNQITEKSLIYITPASDTENKVLYLKAKQAAGETAGWFKVGLDTAINHDIKFNWWIIN